MLQSLGKGIFAPYRPPQSTLDHPNYLVSWFHLLLSFLARALNCTITDCSWEAGLVPFTWYIAQAAKNKGSLFGEQNSVGRFFLSLHSCPANWPLFIQLLSRYSNTGSVLVNACIRLPRLYSQAGREASFLQPTKIYDSAPPMRSELDKDGSLYLAKRLGGTPNIKEEWRLEMDCESVRCSYSLKNWYSERRFQKSSRTFEDLILMADEFLEAVGSDMWGLVFFGTLVLFVAW